MTHNFQHICRICKENFKGKWNQEVCVTCRKENPHYKAMIGYGNMYGIPTGTVGAVNEMKAAIFLMSKGYHVFRALSPSSFCDILAVKNGCFFDIEVRTAHKHPKTGKFYYPKTNIHGKFLALVVGDEVSFIPELT